MLPACAVNFIAMSLAQAQSKPSQQRQQRETCRTENCGGDALAGDYCPECAFVELVDEEPMICSRCYRRKWRPETVTSFDRRHVDEGSYEWVVQDGVWILEGEDWIRTHETERETPPPVARRGLEDRPGHAHPIDLDRAREKTVCACGDFDTARRPTLSKEQAVRCAGRISERLDELGIDHRPALLVAIVEKAKSTSSLAGKDRSTFEKAVAYAVRRA